MNTYIVGCVAPNEENVCRVVAEAFPGSVATFEPTDAPADASVPKWARYLKGMAAMYSRKGFSVPPFYAAVVSDVPLGSGLSSSAALEMATGVLIEQLGSHTVDPADRALMGQSCEHEFAGVPCGIMDQLISSKGQAGRALLIDCRSLECVPVPLDDPNVVIVIANSNVAHELSGSEYPTRRKQCAEAARVIAAEFPGSRITHLRDASLDQLKAVNGKLDAETARRAFHVISEDQRTHAAQRALEARNFNEVGKLMHESHVSLRDLFEVSTKEIDALVEIAMTVDGVYGSRITGGGFGGCTVSLVKKDAVEKLMKAIDEQYPGKSGGNKATVFVTNAGRGARALNHLVLAE